MRHTVMFRWIELRFNVPLSTNWVISRPWSLGQYWEKTRDILLTAETVSETNQNGADIDVDDSDETDEEDGEDMTR